MQHNITGCHVMLLGETICLLTMRCQRITRGVEAFGAAVASAGGHSRTRSAHTVLSRCGVLSNRQL